MKLPSGSGSGSERREQVADYKPRFYYWDCLEMLRKVIITGLIMFVRQGSMLQMVVAMSFSAGAPSHSRGRRLIKFSSRVFTTLHVVCDGRDCCWPGFGFASAWFQPYVSTAANIFKVGVEVALLFTLTLAMLLKVDLEKEDVGEDLVGALLVLSSTILPGATLVAAVLSQGVPSRPARTSRRSRPRSVTRGARCVGLGVATNVQKIVVTAESETEYDDVGFKNPVHDDGPTSDID
jgi:hypothetical protein